MRYGEFHSYVIEPEMFGMKRCDKQEIVGGTPQENAAITKAILSGEQGPRRDAVVLNSAAAIYLARPGITLQDAVVMAKDAIDSGKALAQLERFIALSGGAAR
jgi:anthranilate phosphoribosyltransferase